MANRKSIFPSQPAGCGGPKSGMPMSQTVPSLVPVLVLADDAADVEVELSTGGAPDDPAAEVSV